MKLGRVIGMLAVAGIVLAGCSPEEDSGAIMLKEGGPAPELVLPLTKGAKPVALSSWKGKVVLIDFWATWCKPCRQSIPAIEHIYEKYHAKGLEVVGISVDDEKTAINIPDAVKALKMTYPVVLASDIPDIRSKYNFDGIPQLYLIDKKGNVSQTIAGVESPGSLDARVEALLNEKG
ncbi:MAG: Thiol-disulfide isomerase and thioredoxin [Chthonomonadales bacterium]|nr:Thiol-disulfide isomerase and thioredoxin [Chthonomonadales bacterium]